MSRHRLLLLSVVLVWAASWPIIRQGVAFVPPLWYACDRYLVAAPCLFLLVAWRRELTFPPRADWGLIFVSGGLQMGLYSALTSFALTQLPAGRASVLAFSTPIWVLPLAAWWLEEKVHGRGWIGLMLGIGGACIIAAPSLRAETRGQMLACAALLLAALAWAVSIVYVRAHSFKASTLALAPWQTLIAVAMLLPCAVLFEHEPPHIGPTAMLTLGYVGPIATAFAYWAVVEAGTRLRAGTMSMALLATPILGLLLSAIAAHERVDGELIAGVILVALGVFLSSTPAKAPARQRGDARG